MNGVAVVSLVIVSLAAALACIVLLGLGVTVAVRRALVRARTTGRSRRVEAPEHHQS